MYATFNNKPTWFQLFANFVGSKSETPKVNDIRMIGINNLELVANIQLPSQQRQEKNPFKMSPLIVSVVVPDRGKMYTKWQKSYWSYPEVSVLCSSRIFCTIGFYQIVIRSLSDRYQLNSMTVKDFMVYNHTANTQTNFNYFNFVLGYFSLQRPCARSSSWKRTQ